MYRAWLDAQGYCVDEVTELNIVDLVHLSGRSHCEKTFARLIEGDDVGLINVTFATKDGLAVKLEGSVNCEHNNDQLLSTQGYFA